MKLVMIIWDEVIVCVESLSRLEMDQIIIWILYSRWNVGVMQNYSLMHKIVHYKHS